MISVTGLPLWSAGPWKIWMRRMLDAAGEALYADCAALRDRDADLILVHDADIAACNRDFLGCEGPTNVLSFPAEEDDAIGSLMLSVDTLQRECVLYGQPLHAHAIRLLAHGMGHILGFDHGPEMDALCEKLEHAAEVPGQ